MQALEACSRPEEWYLEFGTWKVASDKSVCAPQSADRVQPQRCADPTSDARRGHRTVGGRRGPSGHESPSEKSNVARTRAVTVSTPTSHKPTAFKLRPILAHRYQLHGTVPSSQLRPGAPPGLELDRVWAGVSPRRASAQELQARPRQISNELRGLL